MAEQTLFDRPERLPAAFDGTELMEVAPTSEGISYKSPVGTAASRDVTTSATDTTLGRLLKFGDFGAGIAVVSSEVDLDQYFLPGNYITPSSGLLNIPAGWSNVDRKTLAAYGTATNYQMQIIADGPPDLSTNRYAMRRGRSEAFSGWVELYHTGNTTVDSNGFIKEASPIIRLFGTGEIEEPCQPTNATVKRKSKGVYEITGTLGFAQKGWYIETPKDANGSIKVLTEYSQDKKGKITVKTYEPTGQGWRPEKGDPIDIPDGRWIDIRLEAPEPEPEETEDAQ